MASASLLMLAQQRATAAAPDKPATAVGQTSSARPKLHVMDLYGHQPLSFERNDGQTDAQVKFISRGDGYTLFLTSADAVLALRKPRAAADVGSKTSESKPEKVESETLRIKLVGANPGAQIEAMDQLAGKSNYFVGKDPAKWHTNIPTYARVKYRNVYSGIDLVYYGASQRQLEYDFVIAPGADPNVIGLRFDGAKAIALDRDGDLILRLADGGEVVHHAPVIYQERDGKREKVEGKSVLKGKDAIGFELAAYDHARPVFIDPGLSYSTFLGGTGGDSGLAIAVDASGFAYVTGATTSDDFPTTIGAFKTTPPGGANMFVAKLEADGSGRVYSTYLGGDALDNGETGHGIAVDSDGNAFITGDAGNNGDFPTTPGAFQPHPSGGNTDGFVTKLSPDGSSLVYSTYLGGTFAGNPGITHSNAIAIDSLGFAYVTGKTTSGNFPTTAGAFQTANNCISCTNVFVTKMKTDGTGLVYSTYLGGSGSPNGGDIGASIAVDSFGNAYVTGTDNSTDFPKTAGAFHTTNSGFSDAFVTKLTADGTGLVYSTYLGGSQPDIGESIAIDSSGSAYVTGYTGSNDFPHTLGAFQTALKIVFGNAFVTKLKPDGSGLAYSTYLGGFGDTADSGFGNDHAFGIAVDSFGHAYVTGETWSSNFYCAGASNPISCCSGGGTGTCNFPITGDAFQSTDNASNFDQPGPNAFMTKMTLDGSGLVYSTYLGGSAAFNGDRGFAIAVDSTGDAYVTGSASSNDFPITAGANQTMNMGTGDAFITKLIVPAGSTPTPSPSPTPSATGTATRTAT
ncbi:MAG TPA: SBBP repeat-containing protein, partial [Candidatus Limnocylindrales bacterium]|nr:SBBP repeat-containing protein [Candidatus Limnocylindrales bacterium]